MTFYAGSAFISLKSPTYHDLFVDNVPLAASVIQYAEDHNWDTLTVGKVIQYGNETVTYIQNIITGLRGESSTSPDKPKETVDAVTQKATTSTRESKDKIKSVASSLTTTVEQAGAEMREKGAKAAAIARHQSVQFSEGVEELVRKAEAALQGKAPAGPESTTTTGQPTVAASDAVLPHDNEVQEVTLKDVLLKPKNVYDAPLPVGFEPPPGYAKPAPPKPAKPAEATPTEPAPEPLPLVAPAISEFSASEPVIAQLASVIDNLASYLNTNPTAAEKARDILDTAQVDLKQLAGRIEEAKEEERRKLEAQLDEQTREYTIKLLELEMEAQDKLDSQESDFRTFFEQEKVKFVEAYREKLNRELQTQSEIINERYVFHVINVSMLPFISDLLA